MNQRNSKPTSKKRGGRRRPASASKKSHSNSGGRGPGGAPSNTPGTLLVDIIGLNPDDGDLFARPSSEPKSAPWIIIPVSDLKGSRLRPGDQALVKLVDEPTDTGNAMGPRLVRASVIRSFEDQEEALVGVYQMPPKGDHKKPATLSPCNRKDRSTYTVVNTGGLSEKDGLKDGTLVIARPIKAVSSRDVKLEKVIGHSEDANAISLIAIHSNDIPDHFPEPVLKDTDALTPLTSSKNREDLRKTPLVTIDGADSRDFDDAVFAEPDTDSKNPGGWHLTVAIADVAHYVRNGNPLDDEAYRRGNSTYFPDRVVPMLPERLSNDLCSLRPNEDRPCLAVHMWIDAQGQKVRHQFVRGLMRSHQRLTYEQVEENKADFPNLFGAYKSLHRARKDRGTLDLNIPEQLIRLDKAGQITNIERRMSLSSHQLIEEFMVLANVCAAETLLEHNMATVFRVHDLPSPEKLEDLHNALKDMSYSLPKGQVPKPKNFMGLLDKAREQPEESLVNTLVLRSQSQALYDTENIGHFGLALSHYAHFTSPIRRYADLLVHRGLISALGLGDDGFETTDGRALTKYLYEAASHISTTERRSVRAERDANDKYVSKFLSTQIGAQFRGTINGVSHHGLFVTLEETGADGYIPMGSLTQDYFYHDQKNHCLTGRRTGIRYKLGDPVTVTLKEAEPLRGGLIFEITGQPTKKQKGRYKGQKTAEQKSGDGGKPPKRRTKKPKLSNAKKKKRAARHARKGTGPQSGVSSGTQPGSQSGGQASGSSKPKKK